MGNKASSPYSRGWASEIVVLILFLLGPHPLGPELHAFPTSHFPYRPLRSTDWLFLLIFPPVQVLADKARKAWVRWRANEIDFEGGAPYPVPDFPPEEYKKLS